MRRPTSFSRRAMFEAVESRMHLSADPVGLKLSKSGLLTITGTAGADHIVVRYQGSKVRAEADGVVQRFSNSKVKRLRVDVGSGDDVVDVHAFRRSAVISLGGGDDIGTGGAGVNSIDGGAGDDQITGGGSADSLVGGAGSDVIKGGDGNDVIHGSNARSVGADASVDGIDTLLGEAGDDWLHATGGEGATHVGGDGNDTLLGDDAADLLSGEDGNDQLEGAGGADRLVGGEGSDDLLGQDGNDQIDGGMLGMDKTASSVDRDVIDGGSGDDQMWGSDFSSNTILGGDGNDYLQGGDNADELDAGDGNDRLFAQGGDDKLDSGAGTDSVSGGDGIDTTAAVSAVVDTYIDTLEVALTAEGVNMKFFDWALRDAGALVTRIVSSTLNKIANTMVGWIDGITSSHPNVPSIDVNGQSVYLMRFANNGSDNGGRATDNFNLPINPDREYRVLVIGVSDSEKHSLHFALKGDKHWQPDETYKEGLYSGSTFAKGGDDYYLAYRDQDGADFRRRNPNAAVLLVPVGMTDGEAVAAMKDLMLPTSTAHGN